MVSQAKHDRENTNQVVLRAGGGTKRPFGTREASLARGQSEVPSHLGAGAGLGMGPGANEDLPPLEDASFGHNMRTFFPSLRTTANVLTLMCSCNGIRWRYARVRTGSALHGW